MALVRQTELTDFLVKGTLATPHGQSVRGIPEALQIFKVSPAVQNAETLKEGEQGLCVRRVGKSWKQFEAEMLARRNEDQERTKNLEDSLKKLSVNHQALISQTREELRKTNKELSKTNESLSKTAEQLSNLMKMVTLREVINTWKTTSKGRELDRNLLAEVKAKYDNGKLAAAVTWKPHENTRYLTDEVKALLRSIEKTKVVPLGEADVAKKTRERWLNSMEEALSLCKTTVLGCSEWVPYLREQVWNLIVIGVKSNDMFHDYGVTREDVLQRAHQRLFIVDDQDLNDIVMLFLDDLPNFGK